MTRAEMLCRLKEVAAESVTPLRLAGGAFHVWSQLPVTDRCSLEAVRGALYSAFALGQYAAYEMFATRRLMPGEAADVFLADLRRLAVLFGRLPERALACAFVTGLPDAGRQTIRAGSRAEGLDLTTVLVRVTTINGGKLRCCGVGSVVVEEVPTGRGASLETVVVEKRPLGVDIVLGVAGISALGGVPYCPRLSILGRQPPAARREYDAELDAWVVQGCLVPYDEGRRGTARVLVPLMAVQQCIKSKVRPVMGYRKLNSFVPTHRADTDVCADQLWRWRRHGANVAVVDLKRAYLQVHVEERLWPFQTVMIRGQRFRLTRLAFSLNIAPMVIKAVVRSVLEQDAVVQRAVLPYVDDLLVNEDVLSAERVVVHFAEFGLDCKHPERAASGAWLLGLRVQAEGRELRWVRDNPVGASPARVTRRAVFARCGRLVAHLPVCAWLRPAAAWLKRRVNQLMRTWDDVTDNAALRAQINYVARRLNTDDPARGAGCVEGEDMVIWTDASSLATGVVAESPDGDVIEDACWLRRDEATHINMAELDAAIRGVDLAVAWGARTIGLRTDSATVHRWLDDAISGRARLQTKAHGELLIRRRAEIVCQPSFLPIIDGGPSRFCVWRPLRRASAAEIVGHLEQRFLERRAPEEVLADNDTVFRGCQEAALASLRRCRRAPLRLEYHAHPYLTVRISELGPSGDASPRHALHGNVASRDSDGCGVAGQ
ncbi:uncharacterized protein LOC119112829 [Pollicipes pollicipes]|uniref:uncharacterized protein LOC119112829 n=1 Tax=Pollicipes pollicipes TaxID=41117 RepID=UPI001884A8A7|nr:uncharacterized protein LOC119112829 [Pollicipes pollicipes]